MKKKLLLVSTSLALSAALLFGSISVFASDSATFVWCPTSDNPSVADPSEGLFVGTNSRGHDFYVLCKSGLNAKLVSAQLTSSGNCTVYLVYNSTVYPDFDDNTVYYRDSFDSWWSRKTNSMFSSISSFPDLRYTAVCSITMASNVLPFYNTIYDALSVLNDGIWNGPAPPVDPDYLFDYDLGYLQDVHYKQVYNEDSGLTTLDVSFSNITSTGVDLSQANYGVAISYQAYENAVDDIPFWKSAIYKLVDLALGADIAFQILSHSNLYGQIQDLIGDFTGGGGGHSFSSPENNEPIFLYDLILSPYYFDGTDEYFGYNTMISKVSVDSVGTRMISTGSISDGGQDDTETYMNSSQVITYYYDYGPESTYLDESIQYYYYITNNDFSTTAVTNNYGDTNTIINNIDNSTDNIYNFQGVGEIPDLDLSAFNIGLQEFIQMIKGVIVSLIIAFPMLSGLFDFLPVFAVSIAIAATQAVAVILIIRIFRGVGI